MYYTPAMAQSSTETSVLRIGSRGSPLALVQAREVQSRLAAACGLPAERIEIKIIRTTGDMIQDRPLAEAGGKGLFTKEIEEALLAGAIDLAVHSSKDMPTVLPAGLVLSAFLPREDARDAFISRKAENAARPAARRRGRHRVAAAAGFGQASAAGSCHRAAARQCRDAAAQDRGRRCRRDGAGGRRIETARPRSRRRRAIFDIEEFLPAVGQGAIGIETRADDARTRALVAAIDDPDTATALAAERAFLAVLDGTCRTPIAGHAQVSGGTLRFRGMIAKTDGSEALEVSREGRRADAAALGADAGRELKGRAGPGFFVQD